MHGAIMDQIMILRLRYVEGHCMHVPVLLQIFNKLNTEEFKNAYYININILCNQLFFSRICNRKVPKWQERLRDICCKPNVSYQFISFVLLAFSICFVLWEFVFREGVIFSYIYLVCFYYGQLVSLHYCIVLPVLGFASVWYKTIL